MARFVLRYMGDGPRPRDVAGRVAALPDARVLDETPAELLVEAPEEALRSLLAGEDWSIAAERREGLPSRGSRVGVKRPRPDHAPPRKR